MRTALRHPHLRTRRAIVGIDRAIGAFVEVRDRERLVGQYDALRPGYTGVNGALRFLVEYGFFTEAQVDEALVWIQHSLAREHEDVRVRAAGTLAEELLSE